jgi:hypothetical protein
MHDQSTFEATLGHAPYTALALPASTPASPFTAAYRSELACHLPWVSRR